MLHYPIAIFKDEDMENYAAIVPDVDGCFPLGDTIAKTIEDAEDSAQYLMNQSTHGITFYRATKLTESKLKITYLQHWSKNHVIQP